MYFFLSNVRFRVCLSFKHPLCGDKRKALCKPHEYIHHFNSLDKVNIKSNNIDILYRYNGFIQW